MKPRPVASSFWTLSEPPARDPSAARAANARSPATPHQLKADRTTSLVRDMTDAAAKERQANVARLRKARLARDAAIEAEPPAPKKRKKP